MTESIDTQIKDALNGKLDDHQFEVVDASGYINQMSKIKFRCKSCGFEFINNFKIVKAKIKRDCTNCSNSERKELTPTEFLTRFSKLLDFQDYECVSVFTGTKSPVSLKHKLCGEIFTVSRAGKLIYPDKPKFYGTCPKCNPRRNTKLYSLEEFKDELDKSTFGQYTVCDGEEYVNNKRESILNKIIFICNLAYNLVKS